MARDHHDDNDQVDDDTITATTCLWKDCEKTLGEQTKRLALVAYCDAADMDGSDPTLWFKVACAARGLGRCTAINNSVKEVDMDDDADDQKEGKEIDKIETSSTAKKNLEEVGNIDSSHPNTAKDASFPNDADMQDEDGNPINLDTAATNSSVSTMEGSGSGILGTIAPPGSINSSRCNDRFEGETTRC